MSFFVNTDPQNSIEARLERARCARESRLREQREYEQNRADYSRLSAMRFMDMTIEDLERFHYLITTQKSLCFEIDVERARDRISKLPKLLGDLGERQLEPVDTRPEPWYRSLLRKRK